VQHLEAGLVQRGDAGIDWLLEHREHASLRVAAALRVGEHVELDLAHTFA